MEWRKRGSCVPMMFSPSSSLTPVLCVYLTHRGDVYIGLVKHRRAEQLLLIINNLNSLPGRLCGGTGLAGVDHRGPTWGRDHGDHRRGLCPVGSLNWEAAILQFISISVNFIDKKVFVTVIVNNLLFLTKTRRQLNKNSLTGTKTMTLTRCIDIFVKE